jgi:hypothetical protein
VAAFGAGVTSEGSMQGEREFVVRDEAREPEPPTPDGGSSGISVRAVALLAFGLAFIVFWYTPAFLYAQTTNARQFYFPLLQVLPVLAIPLVLTVIVLAAPAVFMRPNGRRIYAAFLCCLTVYVCVYGFVFVKDYGLLDGELDLPAYAPAPLFIGAALVIGGALLLARVRPSRILAAWGPVMAVLAVHLVVMVIGDPKPVKAFDPPAVENLYEFGGENLLIVLLDSFQSDVFAEVLGNRPEFTDKLDGFTYYPNMLGVGPSTYVTMPVIHGGGLRPPDQNMGEHFNRSIARDSFENEMADAGWHVTHLNPVGGLCPSRIDDCFRFDASIRDSSMEHLLLQSSGMVDLSLFRLAPPELKGTVYNESRWRLSAAFNSVEIAEASDSTLRDVIRNARKSRRGKTVKFLHLLGTHAPATRRADCSLLDAPVAPVTRRLANDQAECALTRVGQLIDKLKAIGVYDKTTMLLMADTGTATLGSRRVTDPKWTKLIGAANPLFAVKPSGATGRLITNEAQLSSADIRRVICSLTKGCRTEATQSTAVDRPRYFMDYEWHEQFWHALTLKNEQLYEVRGPMTDPGSWKRLSRAALPQVDRLTFGRSDRRDQFGYGWGPVRSDGAGEWRWGVYTDASLNLNLPDDRESRLEFDVGTLPELSNQTVTLKVNLRPVGTARVSASRGTVSFVVPRGVADRAIDELVLVFARYRLVEEGNRHEKRAASLAVRFDELRIAYE